MFSCGGENGYPKEVENLLFGHPDVVNAVVTPLPHQVKGLVRKQLEDSLLKEMSKQGDPSLIQADYRVFLDKVFNLMTERLAWERMRSEYVALYVDTFTSEEIRDMLVFYKTPSGKAMLMKMPTVAARGIVLGRDGRGQ